MKKSRSQHPALRRLNYLWQAALVYFFIGLFWMLPLPTASALGGWIGRHIGTRLGISRRAYKHLNFIFPEKTLDEKKIIVRDMWDNLGRVAAEAPHIKQLGDMKRIVVDGREHLNAALASGRPVMMLSGHFANWEVPALVMVAMGNPMAGVYRRPNNPYVDYLIRKLRRPAFPALFPKGPEGARGMMRWLREGRTVGMLVDQKMNEGIALDFVGKPAMTGIVPAQMALLTNAVMVPAAIIRTHDCHFRVIVSAPIEAPPEGTLEEKVAIITQKINDFLSDHIRRYPGQWLWLHRRWLAP